MRPAPPPTYHTAPTLSSATQNTPRTALLRGMHLVLTVQYLRMQCRYTGACTKIPQQRCRQVKKCVRNPQTKCSPVKRLECGMKKVMNPKKVKQKRCLPFPPRPIDEECSSTPGQPFLPPSLPQPPTQPEGYNHNHNDQAEDISISEYDQYQDMPDHPPFYPSAREELFLPSHGDINRRARD